MTQMDTSVKHKSDYEMPLTGPLEMLGDEEPGDLFLSFSVSGNGYSSGSSSSLFIFISTHFVHHQRMGITHGNFHAM